MSVYLLKFDYVKFDGVVKRYKTVPKNQAIFSYLWVARPF